MSILSFSEYNRYCISAFRIINDIVAYFITKIKYYLSIFTFFSNYTKNSIEYSKEKVYSSLWKEYFVSGSEKRIGFIINSVYYTIIILIVILFIKYLLGPLLPFIIAFIIVSISRKLIIRLEDSSHSKRFASLIFTVFSALILSFALYAITFGLLRELNALTKSISDTAIKELTDSITEKISGIFKGFAQSSPILGAVTKKIPEAIGNLDTTLSTLSASVLPSAISYVMKFVSFFPSAVIFICFVFISMFYISCDYEKICRFLIMQLPERVLDTFDETKTVIFSTAKELFKSYFLLTFITFLQLLIGFLIIGIDYSLLLAAIISIIDLLPILGTGTVLLPWSAICFLLDNTVTAVGLIVLYAVITIFRQVVQPRIIGAGAGLSPLVSLISIFAGLKFMGFAGIIVFPIITTTLIKLNQRGFIKFYNGFPEKNSDALTQTRLKFINFKRNDKHISKSQGSDSHDEIDQNNKES